jgi:tetratricopeptide (TPR) repeat protein
MKIHILAAGLALAIALPAQGAVTVMGGGQAKECSEAALSGKSEARFEEACTYALEAELLSDLDRAGTLVNRGILKLRRKDYAAAKADFDKAVARKPDLGEAYVNRAAALLGAKQWTAALADANKAIDLGIPEMEKAYYNRALAYEGVDDLKAAYMDYQKAIALKPDWEPPKQELARFTVQRR